MTQDELEAMLSSDERHWWYRGRRRVLRARLDRLAVGAGSRPLDAGCGSGRTLDELARFGRASGIDLSVAAVSVARRRGHDDVHVAAVEEMPFADAAPPRSDLGLTLAALDRVLELPSRVEARLIPVGPA